MGYDMHWRERPDDIRGDYRYAASLFDHAVAERDALPDEERGEVLNREDWHREDLPLSAYVGRTERYHAAQEAVHNAYVDLQRAQQYYFQLNIWGMGRCREWMDEFAMVYPSAPDGEWPDYDEELNEAKYKLEADEVPRDAWPTEVLAYVDEQEEFLCSGVQERPGIALHKFGSNDGWIVTPLECMGAVEQWKRAVLGPAELGTGDRRVETLLAKATDRAATTFESEAFTAKAIELMEAHELPEWWPEWIAFLVGAANHGGFEVF